MRIPELESLEAIEKQISTLVSTNQAFYDQLKGLLEQRNQLAAAAEKEVRKHEIEAGPFKIHRRVTKYDADKLYEEAGADMFAQLGGYVETIQVRKIDPTKFQALLQRGGIPQEIADVVCRVEVHYRKVGTYQLP